MNYFGNISVDTFSFDIFSEKSFQRLPRFWRALLMATQTRIHDFQFLSFDPFGVIMMNVINVGEMYITIFCPFFRLVKTRHGAIEIRYRNERIP